MSLWSCICFSSAGDINRERFSVTLALIFAAPAGFPAIMIFTGAEFPVSQLPRVGQVISRVLPLTRSIEAMNLLFSKDTRGFAVLLLGELAMAVIYVIDAVSVLKYADGACRKAGKYDLF